MELIFCPAEQYRGDSCLQYGLSGKDGEEDVVEIILGGSQRDAFKRLC